MAPTDKDLEPKLPLDPYIEKIIKKLPKSRPVSYPAKEQMLYLARLAAKLGLYAAQDYINHRLLSWNYDEKTRKIPKSKPKPAIIKKAK